MNQNQAIAHLIQTADHGMIYRRGDKGHVIYHAALGEHQSGVRGHLFSKVIKDSELGDCYVLRFKDEKLASALADVVERLNPKLSQEALSKLPKKDGVITLPTPFANFFERNQDTSERVRLHELFRAFRAHMRSHDEQQPEKRSLSKNKGISCSNFVAYAVKIAIIDRVFPQGVPDSLLSYYEVDYIARKGYQDNPIKKLSDLDKSFFEEFSALVLKELNQSEDIPSEIKMDLYDFLCLPVKGYNISAFYSNLTKFPKLYSEQGYLLIQQEVDNHGKETLTPAAVSLEGLKIISKHYEEAGQDIAPIKLTKEFLSQIEPLSADPEKSEIYSNYTGPSI
ncbi:hypothetical protein [Legionella beliardensis]|nr:hypothetical protein [Legionella beliardensis]